MVWCVDNRLHHVPVYSTRVGYDVSVALLIGAVTAPDSQRAERTESEQAADAKIVSVSTSVVIKDSVGLHRVWDSTNANEENNLRIENRLTGEENDGEGTPISPSTQADEPDTPTVAA
eukprot:scaffold183070_cov70-Attheya_sp.AAC.1